MSNMHSRQIKCLVVAALCCCFVGNVLGAEKSATVFGVKPGMMVQSSYFGIGFNRVAPYIGLDWVGIAESGEGNDMSASLFIPHLGAKLYLRDYRLANTVTPYLIGDFFFSLPSVSVDGYTSEEEDYVKDLMSFKGIGVGFGTEYFFTENFSVGGEYGIRYLHNGVKEHEQTYHDYYYGDYVDTINEKFSIAFKLTYAAISANFFF
jgi:hypothetical protein